MQVVTYWNVNHCMQELPPPGNRVAKEIISFTWTLVSVSLVWYSILMLRSHKSIFRQLFQILGISIIITQMISQ